MTRKTFTLRYEDCIKIADEFYARIDTSGGPDACHTGAFKSGSVDGYSAFYMWADGKKRYVHATRIMYVLKTGEELVTSHHIDHVVCRNPPCVNINHIRKTDAKGNAETCKRDGTGKWRKQFTDEEVIELRKRWQSGDSISQLTKEAGRIQLRSMMKIIKGTTYKHLPLFPRPEEFGRVNGEIHLSEHRVSIIKARLLLGHVHRHIAEDEGVSRSHVSNIHAGTYWSDVEPMPLKEYHEYLKSQDTFEATGD